ncbi:MAG: tRNA 2-thiocytidine(32) synthetase TtcA, partial [Clostridia bacterium]|nr:tRNA 2-thiocytidine(32) synthetase TtcA [Clostridia bacterium]
MDKKGVHMIRPMIYLEEYDIRSTVDRLGLPIVNNPCPMNHVSKREYAKDLIKHICKDIPFAKERILGAIYHPERNNLWQKPEKPADKE